MLIQPSKPTEPRPLELHETNFVKLIYRSKYFIICCMLYYYWMYIENDFKSIYIYYVVIGFYILRHIWPALIQNGDIRKKNRKMNESYKKEIIKYEKSLKDYYILKNRMELERQRKMEIEQQNKKKLEQQIRMETERQNRIHLNRQISMEVERQNKSAIITPEEEIKVRFEKIKERLKSQPASNIKDSTIIKKFDNQLDIEINNTIKKHSAICAALSIQPIPFADIFILTPTQILMGKKIADLRGYEIKGNTIELILKEISGIIGMGIIAQQLVIGAYKTFLPFFGGVTTIPVVYGLTFAIGKAMDYYITAKINGNQINKSEIEKIFKSSREIGEREGKLKEKEIQVTSKK